MIADVELMENGTPVTKADLLAALVAFKSETKADLTTALAAFRVEAKADLTALKDEFTGTMGQVETNLFTEFHRYGKGQQIRLHSLETRDASVIERLAIIEEQLLHLESRRPPTV